MSCELIVHPTASYAKPRTARKAKAKVSRETTPKPEKITVAGLHLALTAAGLKFTTKHTKAELMLILSTGQYTRPAAYAKRAARKMA